jgi:hypothetical protein
MGVVYRARDTRLNRSVAFKVLSSDFTSDPDRKARFLQEARSASAVNHPAIAQIYGVDEADGVTFIAMELVEGRTVRQLVADRELDVLGAVEIAIQVAEGLAKAHAARIVHRDIKTDNIIVTPDGHAKILDFGLAKPIGGGDGEAEGGSGDPEATVMRTLQATQAGMVVGTIGYMSPEQARGRSLDDKSDIFSLGVVLYEMVTGRMPFQGESPLDTLHAIAFEETEPVTSIRSNLPVSLHRVVTRCLRKRPEDRYESAEMLVRDLRQVSREIDSGITRRVPLAERIREGLAVIRDTPRGEWLVPALVALVVVTLLLFTLWTARPAMPGLITVGVIGLFVYRRFRNQRARLLKSFGKKAAKMEEVRLIAVQGERITVLVENPLAKTFVHLNALLERANGKLFRGQPFALSIREEVPDEELRALLQGSAVVYADERLELPAAAADAPPPA